MPNRLADEVSPYLQQHADNPVDWYPWGAEALSEAKAEDKPTAVSIGYSACHWCHVMEHESFEDPATAQLMNEHFVSIKVDREERPDLDQIYMTAVQAMTRQRRLADDRLPDAGRHAVLRRHVLSRRTTAWACRRSGACCTPSPMPGRPSATRSSSSGEQIRASILAHRPRGVTEAGDARPRRLLERAVEALGGQFDRAERRLRRRAKFPQPMDARVPAARQHRRDDDRRAARWSRQTLDKMARGGMYDQLGGGFHRYALDADWLVPHFEKMLYDNAQLARVYLMRYQVTGRRRSTARVAEQTLDYVAARDDRPGRRLLLARRMPTARARRASSTSGRRTRSDRALAGDAGACRVGTSASPRAGTSRASRS